VVIGTVQNLRKMYCDVYRVTSDSDTPGNSTNIQTVCTEDKKSGTALTLPHVVGMLPPNNDDSNGSNIHPPDMALIVSKYLVTNRTLAMPK